MIVPMKKVSIVLLEKERKTALKTLRKAGVLHIEELAGNSEKLAAYKANLADSTTALSVLAEIKLPKGKKADKKLSADEALGVCKRIISLSGKKKELLETITNSTSELERLSAWGDVEPKDFEYLREKNIFMRMYEIPEDKYKEIPETLETIRVNGEKKAVRFLLLGDYETRPAELPPEAFEVTIPQISTVELKSNIDLAHKEVEKVEAEINENAVCVPAIKEYQKILAKDIEFENVYSGMGREEEEKDTSLAWLSGYVPVDSFEKLSACARENGWAFASEDANPEDNVPTKLRNNKFVQLIYPLTDFLGTVPGYNEFDISGWFLLFFTIFFGMIFGDAGYGGIITLGILFAMIKTAASGKKIPSAYGLFLMLGLATIVWGTLTCTWFGLTPDKLPEFLKALSCPPISNAYSNVYDGVNKLSTAQNLQIFCFSLAFLQLTVAHLKCIARNRKSLKCIGDFGSMILLWGMYYIVLMLVVSGEVFSMDKVVAGIPIGTVAIALIAAGFVLNFIFANYEGNLLASIMESVKNIITVILNVVNVFSDIVSYIRLWAVGLAGSAISATVNQMAGPMFGHAAMFIFFVALLVFGHGLNMILNVLSVIVHGVRLNTLEFSNHLGMAWAGYKYNPFSETVEN